MNYRRRQGRYREVGSERSRSAGKRGTKLRTCLEEIICDHLVIYDLLEELNRTFHRLRQSGIDEELFDLISGFEALSTKDK